ncbi:MAG: ABC transporter permease [Planctomycetes bacterium]|nr:ABC transporter permease [Planctomycetota bacterium]
MRLVGLLGRSIIHWFTLTVNWWTLLYLTIKSVFVEKGKGKILTLSTIRKQVLFTGLQALSLITLIAIFTGILIGTLVYFLNANEATKSFTPYVQTLFTEFTITTLTPLFISLVIIARSGTAIASELATMKINKEVKLLESLGINLYYFVIFPRVVGMMISMLCLTVYYHFFALVTEYTLITILDVNLALNDTLRALTIPNFTQSLLKMFFISISIAIIPAYYGLSAEKSYTEVPQVTTKGVVSSIVVTFILTMLFTVLFAFIFGLSFTQQRIF